MFFHFFPLLSINTTGVILKNTTVYYPHMPRILTKENMVIMSLHIPRPMLEELDELVKNGIFPSRSEAIRVAIRDLLLRERARRLNRVADDDEMLMSGK